MRLYITRHGQTEWNLEGKMQGQHNSNLTELGKQQAKWLGESLITENIDLVVSSPSGRAVETAELIVEGRNIPVVTNEGLQEIFLGPWEGMKHDEIKEAYPAEYHNLWHEPEKFIPEDKETIGEVINRAKRTLDDIIKLYPNKNVLIVSHALLIKGIYASVKQLPVKEFWSGPYMNPTNLSIVDVEDEQLKFLLEGDTSHYQD